MMIKRQAAVLTIILIIVIFMNRISGLSEINPLTSFIPELCLKD